MLNRLRLLQLRGRQLQLQLLSLEVHKVGGLLEENLVTGEEVAVLEVVGDVGCPAAVVEEE